MRRRRLVALLLLRDHSVRLGQRRLVSDPGALGVALAQRGERQVLLLVVLAQLRTAQTEPLVVESMGEFVRQDGPHARRRPGAADVEPLVLEVVETERPDVVRRPERLDHVEARGDEPERGERRGELLDLRRLGLTLALAELRHEWPLAEQLDLDGMLEAQPALLLDEALDRRQRHLQRLDRRRSGRGHRRRRRRRAATGACRASTDDDGGGEGGGEDTAHAPSLPHAAAAAETTRDG